MVIITSAELTCASVTGKFCNGIGIVKKILAPEIEIPSEAGSVSTLGTIPKASGKTIITI